MKSGFFTAGALIFGLLGVACAADSGEKEAVDDTTAELLAQLPVKVSSPEYRIECSEEAKKEIVAHVKTIFAARKDTQLLTIDGLRATTPYGWGLIRASNTQAAICLRFESDTEQGMQQLQQDFLKALTPYFDPKALRRHFES